MTEHRDDTGRTDAAHRKIVNAWCLYDWANSAFACTILAAVFPPFYRSVAMTAGLASNEATASWGFTSAVALMSIAVLAPVLGAISDYSGGKKRFVAFFAGTGILGSAAFVLIGPDAWLFASILFIIANAGWAGANIFYESLLPHIASSTDIDRISTRGFALGYIGGGILLIVNVLWITNPALFGFMNSTTAIKASFLSVAVWWALFSIPFFHRVPEPRVVVKEQAVGPTRSGFARVAGTAREIRRYKQLMIFLAAFWIYNDGIGTIIKMATAYGDEIGIRVTDLILALVITQFVGIPFTFLFGRLAGRFGAKKSVLASLAVYTAICIAGYFMTTALHFYLLAFAVGMVQGGSQALSRSIFGSMVPRHKSGEFFGFFSTSEKFAGIAGPVLFGLVSRWAGNSRLSIVALIVFFIVGGCLLMKVDVEEGGRVARAEEAAVRTT